MKLYFSIDALSLLGNTAWRLQINNTWRSCAFGEPLQESDAKVIEKEDVRNWVNVRLQKNNETGLKVKGKSGMFDFLMRGIFAHVILHRLSPSPLPNKDLMVQTIAHAEVGTPWLLHLDLAGNFRMLHSEETPIIANPDIAVRGEIASSAAYVGEDAIKNIDMMDVLYHQFIAGWLAHLETSRLSVFVPDIEDIRSIEECVRNIQDWKHE